MNFTLLGVCFGKTQTCRKGAGKGPACIRKAFPKLETYISGMDLTEEVFFNDMGDIDPKDLNELKNKIYSKLKNAKDFPVIIGGEHTVARAVIEEWINKGFGSLKKPKSVVIIDAHPDCEDSEGHDGIARKIGELAGFENLYLLGIRACSKKENEFIEKNKIKLIKLKDLKNIPGHVYLSIDFDALDPSVLPAVGNPEPDGMKFKEIVEAVKILSGKLIGIDFVEFTPFKWPENEVYALIAGKLIYSCLAEIVKASK